MVPAFSAKQLEGYVSGTERPLQRRTRSYIAKLQGLSGNDFDTEYIKAMVKDHQDDMKEFQSEAQMAQDPSVKQVAQQGQNVISQHLQMIEQVAKNHNVPVEGKEISSTK